MKHFTDHTAARQTSLFRQIDWFTTLIPFLCILALCAWFVISPESSTNTISAIRNFLGDEMGSYYLIIGLGVFVCSLYILERSAWVKRISRFTPASSGAP